MPHNYPIFFKNVLWAAFLPMMVLSLYLMNSSKTIILLWTIMSSNSLQIQIPLMLDPAGTAFSATVLFISANIMQFTNAYMASDPFMKRFCIMVILFITSMNMLIFIPHMMALLLGWDGLGITSFILVVYYQNPKSLAAGMITALSNRVGDAAILLSVALTLTQGHWSLTHVLTSQMNYLIIPIMVLAAMTKSAQIPFSSWLPAAMAAPTPVSALVHSSTLVTAGVFLLLRFYPSIDTLPASKPALLLIATVTMFMAGASAMVECDMKKIIALSTLSQLGVMIGAIALSLPSLSFFHLVTHAMFKALLFMAAGTLISLFQHAQDLRSMGSLSKQLPLTMTAMLLASLALCGTPFLAGFYSKDMILETLLFNPTNALIVFMFMIATLLTALYSTRMVLMLAWSPSMTAPLLPINDESHHMTTPMMIMTFMAVSVGAMMNWMMFSPINEPFMSLSYKSLPTLMTFLGACVSLSLLLGLNSETLPKSPYTHHLNSSMWYLTPLSTQNMLKLPLAVSHHTLKILDHGWVESLSAQGALTMSASFSKPLQLSQNNIITTSIMMTFFIISMLVLI